MNRTSKVLRRLGVPVLAAVTILSGEAALGAASANAVVAPTLTITNQGPNDTTNDAYGSATPDQPTSQTVTLANGPAAAQAISITVTGHATIADPGGQAAGNTLAIGAGGNTATCTTSATPGSQACLFAVHDTLSEAVTVTAHDQSDPTVADDTNNDHFNSLTYTNCPQNATNTTVNCATQQAANTAKTYTVTYLQDGSPVAGRNISFTLNGGQATLVPGSGAAGHNGNIIFSTNTGCSTDAAGHCDVTVQANQNASGSGDLDATSSTSISLPSNVTPYPDVDADQGISYIPNATPSRLDLVATRVLEPTNQNGAALRPGDAVQKTYRLFGGCTITAGQTNCTGSPLSGVSVTVNTDHGFVTPNCFTGGAAGAPASAPVNSTYADCSFTPAAATNGPVGSLTSSGTSTTVTTDTNGYFTVTFGIGRDTGFDANGTVVQTVTATATGGTGTLSETNPGQAAAPCATNGSTAGCTPPGTTWSTNNQPLNGASVKIVWISNPAPGSDIQVGGTQDGNVFVLHDTDQFGNLTSAPGENDLVVSGAGASDTFECFHNYSNNDPCTFTNGGAFTQPNGVATLTITGVDGSYMNAFDSTGHPSQDRFFVDSNGEEGAQTITGTFHAPVTTFGTFTHTVAGNSATYPAATTSDKTDTATINYYKPVPTTFTFTTTPSSSVPAGTVVTVSATVLDQKGKGIPGLTANFIRSGPQTQSGTSCTATQAAPHTNTSGQAGFSFTCQNPSNQAVTVVITDASGNELKRSTQNITFTGTVAKTAISAHLSCSSPRPHHLHCLVTVKPVFANLVVTLRDASGHWIASKKTNQFGKVNFYKKGYKSHTRLRLHVRVAGSAKTKAATSNAVTVTIK